MGLVIFFGVIIIFMIIDDRKIKRDIKSSAKSKFTNKDAEHYISELRKLK